MRKLILAVLPLLAAGPLPLAAQEDGHISCRQMASLPDAAMALYVGGVMDGIGLSFAISNVTAETLAGRAATEGEKTNIEQMRTLPQQYFDPGPAMSRDDVLTAVNARCKADPDQTVDSAFLSVVGKS
jgi:hypothetical protein